MIDDAMMEDLSVIGLMLSKRDHLIKAMTGSGFQNKGAARRTPQLSGLAFS